MSKPPNKDDEFITEDDSDNLVTIPEQELSIWGTRRS